MKHETTAGPISEADLTSRRPSPGAEDAAAPEVRTWDRGARVRWQRQHILDMDGYDPLQGGLAD